MELSDFLMSLAEDPGKAADLRRDPHAVLAEAGLADKDRELLLSGDPVAIHDAIIEELFPGTGGPVGPPRPHPHPHPHPRPGPPGPPGPAVVVVVVVVVA
jgi:hypothetical protein